MAKIQRLILLSSRDDKQQVELSHIAGENAEITFWQFLSKVNIYPSYDPTIPL